MCHVVLSMPILGLALFYFFPLQFAAPFYGLVVVLSLGMYFLVIKAMRQPVVSGPEGMIGATAEALQDFDSEGKVRYGGEIWDARSAEPVRKGEEVVITAVRGLQLIVSRNKSRGT